MVKHSELLESVNTLAFVNGEFVEPFAGKRFESLNPATGEKITDVASCDERDVDRAVDNARAVFNSGTWSKLHPSQRGKILNRLASLLEQHGEELAALESIDSGKPITACREFDIPDTIESIRWYAEAADKVFGKTTPAGNDAIGLVVHEPIGVVAAVLPWNFPLAMLAWKLGPALASGNSVVVKPPELTSLTTLRFAELAVEAGVPAGVLNVVPGPGRIAGKALGMHADVDIVSFTGSNDVGRKFIRYSADSNLKKVVLELGGKAPQIVTADNKDRLDIVARDLAEAAFGNMGQNCTAGSRILVDRSIYDQFVEQLRTATSEYRVGDPQEPTTTIGALVEEAALTRVMKYVDDAVADGATAVAGGSRALEETGGWFYPPTVLTDVREDMPVAREEIFGPVVVVLPFEDIDDAIRIANDTPFGLAANVWSRDIDSALRLARSIRAGTVSVNGYSEGDITTPFGGFKESGFGGRDNGLEAFEQYTEIKTIWISLH